MNRQTFFRLARATLWLAAAALLFAALSPTLNAWRAQGQPTLFAALCATPGFVRIDLNDQAVPTQKMAHGPDCAWCLSPGALVALAGRDVLRIAAAIGREPAPVLALQPFLLSRHHAFAWPQAPPTFS